MIVVAWVKFLVFFCILFSDALLAYAPVLAIIKSVCFKWIAIGLIVISAAIDVPLAILTVTLFAICNIAHVQDATHRSLLKEMLYDGVNKDDLNNEDLNACNTCG